MVQNYIFQKNKSALFRKVCLLLLMVCSLNMSAQTPPWPLQTNSQGNDIILHNGIAAVTCHVTGILPAGERWTFGMISLNGSIPNSGRSETTNTDSMYHHNSWHIDEIGNVFGIDINEITGEVFLTASSNYGGGYIGEVGGISILQYGSIGGGDNVTGAGAVYKIDAVTGQASLFATLPQRSTTLDVADCEFGEETIRSNVGVGLGNIVWDEYRDQYFVTNIEDGRIYRLDNSGNILDSYDPFTYDNGAAGISILDELPYGIVIEPGGNRLLFGDVAINADGNPGIYSIALNSDGSFAGTVDNSNLPNGASYDNYVGTETLHLIVPVTNVWESTTQVASISDLEFDADGHLLVGVRIGCFNTWFSSYNHDGTSYRVELDAGTNLYSNNLISFDVTTANGEMDDNYGGIDSYTDANGNLVYAISSSDILTGEGPHGIAVWEASNSSASPISPLGAISYGYPELDDPKGVGGDIDIFRSSCDIALALVAATMETCNGNGDGQIEISGSSGDPGFSLEYSIDGGTTWQTGTTFSSLTEGNYTIIARDANQGAASCTKTLSASLAPSTTCCSTCATYQETFETIAGTGYANATSSGGGTPANLSGMTDAAGSAAGNSNSSLVNGTTSTATLVFDHTFVAGTVITLSLAKNNASGAVTISDGNAAGDMTFDSGTQDELQAVSFTLSQATNQITVTRTAGSVWVDGASYTDAVVSAGFACIGGIDADGLANVSCMGTNAITLDLTPTTLGGGTTYNVSVSGGGASSISPTSGTYGATTTFTLNDNSAGGGDVTITIADVDDPTCTTEVVVTDPGTCASTAQADLALDKTVDTNISAIGNQVVFTVTVLNEGQVDATGVEVTDILPAGLSYVSDNSGGNYNSGTGLWTIGNVAIGASTSIEITAMVDADGVMINSAEITAMNETDTDSTPNNNMLVEDDQATACVSVPMEVCSGSTFNIQIMAEAGLPMYQWYKDGVAIDGATTDTYIATEAGTYTYTSDGVGPTGDCTGELCCPVIIQEISCCEPVRCLPITITKLN